MKQGFNFPNERSATGKVIVVSTVKEIREVLRNKAKIGLVPTMGALHSGHKNLIERSVAQNEITVVSIFVNPTQFGVNEDFDKYPRTFNEDAKICEELGVDYIFAPAAGEMYSDAKSLTMICPSYNDVDKLCGRFRTGHFDGVATVVGKLFNIIKPTRAYFGKKDAQQLFIIKKMVSDLNFDIEIIECPTIREKDGLAISSRNTYLDEKSRETASNISRTLFKIKELFENGINDHKTLSDTALAMLSGFEDIQEIEYFEIVNANNFEIYENIDIIKQNSIALIAVKINGVRLIDNVDL